MTTRGRWMRAATAALLLALAPSIPGTTASASASRGSSCAVNVVPLYTFRIEAEPDKKAYRAGEMGEVHVLVTRPGNRDPLGVGPEVDHPVRAPAEDVTVGVWLTAAKDYSVGAGLTNADGMANVSIEMPRLIPKGWSWATAYVFAFRTVAETPCFIFEEQGLWERARFVRVKR